MHWILQNNLFNESAYQVLLETLERFGIPHSIHKVVPFIGELHPAPELDTNNVMCMGSYSMRHVAKANGWYPGVFDLWNHDFTAQLMRWGSHMLNHDSVVCHFDQANFEDEMMFIRPIHDSKSFAGRVFDREEFYEWKRKVCVLEEDYGDSLTKNTLIQLCKPKKIYSEHRFWVVKGKVATSSTYKLGNAVIYQSLAEDSIFQKFAEERIAEWQPAEAFVIDIADTAEGLKVVEINTINSCGFYACDMQKLVMAFENNFSKE